MEAWWYPPDEYPGIPVSTQVHGAWSLPPRYRLVPVPAEAPLRLEQKEGADAPGPEAIVPAMYSPPKVIISFAQAIWATVTLYRARGDQVNRYGYAAFGVSFHSAVELLCGGTMLTVYPYPP